MQLQSKVPLSPFEKIALSCSGGGYRAATFHLGSMSYLHHLTFRGRPVLENVKLLSTVSGGTITGAVYALKKQEGASFEEIYHFLIDTIGKIDLVKLGIQKLNPGGEWQNKHKRKNLINAFAELYNQEFTQGATFADLKDMKSHIEAVVFNSTEFTNAVNFRFRSSGWGIFGNNYLRIPDSAASEVKVADAMASSACFPGGFEPIVWPDDFVYDGAKNLESYKRKYAKTGLMDGGIYDNQGLESILNYKKTSFDPYFDLIIVSDVTSPYMEPFGAAADREKKGWRNLTLKQLGKKTRNVNLIVNAVLISLIILLIGSAFYLQSKALFWSGLLLGFGAGLFLVLVAKLLLLSFVKRIARSILGYLQKKIPPFYFTRLAQLNIGSLSLRRVEPLFLDRLNSLLTLLLDVFLKVVRRLNYYKLYGDDSMEYRRISNLIRELTERDFCKRAGRNADENVSESLLANSVLKGEYDKVVQSNIKQVAEAASTFGTTLWFTETNQVDKMLEKLVATGQFTMCFNILEYLEKMIYTENNGFAQLEESTRNEVLHLYNQAKTDWLHFVKDPFHLSDKMARSKKM